MAFSTKKLKVLNNLINYIAALLKGQFPKSVGDIKLGDLLGNYRIFAAGSVTQTGQTTNTTVSGVLTTDSVIAIVNTDDTVAPAVAITASIPSNGIVRTVSKGAATGTNAVVKYIVLRSQS